MASGSSKRYLRSNSIVDSKDNIILIPKSSIDMTAPKSDHYVAGLMETNHVLAPSLSSLEFQLLDIKAQNEELKTDLAQSGIVAAYPSGFAANLISIHLLSPFVHSSISSLTTLMLVFRFGSFFVFWSFYFCLSYGLLMVVLIAGHDENGPSLYYTDPFGTFWQCNAKAIGSGSEGADSSLQDQYNKDITLQEAETIALSILKQVMEEKVTPNNVDIAKVAPNYHLYSPSEMEVVISRL
ncbi:hypothetical protein HHK36_024139 [Tetracentron sinense]|uniref:Proteasome subunit alpha type 5 n=1 Tax=Tetracentron sinense TaxID=13715 RepID=A0A834YKG3_TETSI|nr:hypothetical protein HHK36_024139 [Tetracentron sinense]